MGTESFSRSNENRVGRFVTAFPIRPFPHHFRRFELVAGHLLTPAVLFYHQQRDLRCHEERGRKHLASPSKPSNRFTPDCRSECDWLLRWEVHLLRRRQHSGNNSEKKSLPSTTAIHHIHLQEAVPPMNQLLDLRHNLVPEKYQYHIVIIRAFRIVLNLTILNENNGDSSYSRQPIRNKSEFTRFFNCSQSKQVNHKEWCVWCMGQVCPQFLNVAVLSAPATHGSDKKDIQQQHSSLWGDPAPSGNTALRTEPFGSAKNPCSTTATRMAP